MAPVLIKRDDGSAFLLACGETPEGVLWDRDDKLDPDDEVDGRLVKDWPVGVHKVAGDLRRSGGGRE